MTLDVTEESKIKKSWTKVKLKLPLSIYGDLLMFPHNNRLYIWGTESSDYFDPAIGFDISVIKLPMSHEFENTRVHMDRSIIFEDHIYTLGLWGPLPDIGPSKCVYKYDLATGSWLEGIPMLAKRSE